jgi:hypothetical protein
VTKNKPRIPEDMQRWIDARKRFHLSHAQVQMARELGMNARKLGSWTTTSKNVGKLRFRSSSNSVIAGALARLSPTVLFPSRTERGRLPRRKPKSASAGKAPRLSVRNNSINRNENRRSRGDRLSGGGSILNPLSSILDPAILNPTARTSRPFPSPPRSAGR